MTSDKTRRLLTLLAAAGLAASALTACKTMEGAGEDIEDAGEAIQDNAEDADD